jgi:Arm DNA-binding domain/BrnA antitoxin of type II toxin-antitoxin system
MLRRYLAEAMTGITAAEGSRRKPRVTLRLDPTVLAGLRATGPGWQTKANAVLKAWLAKAARKRPRRMRKRGRNLYLQVSGAHGRSWVFRYTVGGRERAMGLGSAADVPLAMARAAAQALRLELRAGIDPIEARRKARLQAPSNSATPDTLRGPE